MTEKEKLKNGLMYHGFDNELTEERKKAKDMLFDFNNLRPSMKEKCDAIIKELFGHIGDKFWIESPFYCDYGYNISIGNNFYVNHNCVILDCARVTIGDNVLIGPNTGIYTAGHAIDPEQRALGLEYAFPITIGNNVWIGGGCSILAGVTIGDNSVIAAGSVVNKDIPPNVVAAGNPCRVIRKITDEDIKKYRTE
jgi:acetyltransferase-like isoleucine patch superfamily enzyme